mgnify:CR=1 FL=1
MLLSGQERASIERAANALAAGDLGAVALFADPARPTDARQELSVSARRGNTTADREGADGTMRDLELMIALGGEVSRAGAHSRGHGHGLLDLQQQVVKQSESAWIPLIARTVSTRGTGVPELLAMLEKHRAWLSDTVPGAARRREAPV